jgi:hypothetical protein
MVLRKDKNNLYIKRLALQELLFIRDWKLLVLSKYISYKMVLCGKKSFLEISLFSIEKQKQQPAGLPDFS